MKASLEAPSIEAPRTWPPSPGRCWVMDRKEAGGGAEGRGAEEQGAEGHGAEEHGAEGHGAEGHGAEGHGVAERGDTVSRAE